MIFILARKSKPEHYYLCIQWQSTQETVTSAICNLSKWDVMPCAHSLKEGLSEMSFVHNSLIHIP